MRGRQETRAPGVRRGALALPAAVAVVALAAAAPAAAETCVFAPGASSWGPVDSVSGAGLGGSCTPDATDAFTIPSGASVTCADDLALAPASSGRNVIVEAGGSLTCTTAGGAARISLGRILRCEEGASCVLRGDHLRLGVATPSFQPTLPVERYLPAGRPIPCGGWDDSAGQWVADCAEALADPGDVAGSRFQRVLRWDLAGGSPPAFLAETLDAVAAELAAGFTLYVTVEDDDALLERDDPPDENYQYEIVAADSDWGALGSDAVLVLELSQSDPLDRKDSAYPLDQRAFAIGTLERALPAGTLGRRPVLVETQDAVLPDDLEECTDDPGGGIPCAEYDHYHPRQGQWIAFDCQGEGLPCRWLKISRTRDAADAIDVPRLFADCQSDPCDRIEIYDPRGLPYALAAGTGFWITPAPLHEGDPLTVQRRLHIESAGSQAVGVPGRSLQLYGDGLVLDNAVVEDVGMFIQDSDGLTSSYVHVRDPYWGAASTGIAVDLVCNRDLHLDHWQITGGADAASTYEDTTHGFHIRPCADASTDGPQRFTHNGLRYVGDDHWSASISKTVEIELVRSRAQFRSLLADSSQPLQTGPDTVRAVVTDFECTRCSSADFSTEVGPGVLNPETEVSGLMVWGIGSQLGDSKDYVPESGPEWKDVFVLGAPTMLPNRLRNGVVALGYNRAIDIGGAGAGAIRGQTDEVRNLLVRDLEIGSHAFGNLAFVWGNDQDTFPADRMRVANSAFWGLQYTAATPCNVFRCGLVRLLPPPSGWQGFDWGFDDTTFLWREDEAPHLHSALVLQGQAGGSAEIIDVEGLAIAQLDEDAGDLPQALGLTSSATQVAANWAATEEGPCVYDVDELGSPDPTPNLPDTFVDDVDPEWTDPAGGAYESVPLRARGCGALPGRLSPGLHGPLRMESWMQVPAESLAGIGVDAAGPEEVMIRNGGAPPAAANVVDDARYAADDLYVRDVDCPTPVVTGGPEDACALPGAATAARLEAGASVGFNLTVLDRSSLELAGGSVAGRLALRGEAAAHVTGGSVGHASEVRDGAAIEVGGGALDGGLLLAESAFGRVTGGAVAGARLRDAAILRIGGGTWSGPVVLEDTTRVFVEGESYLLDGVPTAPGAPLPTSGTLVVSVASGPSFEFDFERAAGAAVVLGGSPVPVPALPGGAGAPAAAALAAAAAHGLGRAARRRRGGAQAPAQSPTSKAWFS